MRQHIKPPPRLRGTLRPPGDKSISHRAALFNALAPGQATIRNYSPGEDCTATLRCLRALGLQISLLGTTAHEGPAFTIEGGQLREPTHVLNAGNSGTTLRLLAGALAAQPFLSVLTGDRSLRGRPMERIIAPLRSMGAHIHGRQHDILAPLVIQGGPLRGIEYRLPVASAQVKSALLLAGLQAQGETVLHQPAPSRDHTERLFQAMGASVCVEGLTVRLHPGQLQPLDMTIPADISSAAYWLVAAICHPDARIRVVGTGVNPTRTGILDALRFMGSQITLENRGTQGGEPVADLVAQSSTLTGIEVGGDLVPTLIDEVPVLALAACFAQGTTVIHDAAELRVKESDRIRTTARELARLGADVTELPDGLVIRGTGQLRGTTCRSYRDHRLAMTLGIAGLLARGETTVAGAEAASVSYPSFWQDLETLSTGRSEGGL